ncbi:MAG TPA: SPFH domain-containing protein [Buchnera sp. (in: enterobacteria)]|nr:SPFH domain-containing protein [Buchnera sp. (in: enterobacteria)]
MTWKNLNDKKFNLNLEKKKNKTFKNCITQKIKNTLLWLKKIIVQFSNNINVSKNFKKSVIITLSILFLFFLFGGFYNIGISDCGVITRFGKFNRIVQSGLHWKPIFIDEVKRINIIDIQERIISGLMLTADAKVIYIQTNIKYKIVNPKDYLFTVVHPEYHLCDIIENALYSVINDCSIHQILFKNSMCINNIKNKILEQIKNYKIGIFISDIKIQKIYLPNLMKNTFKKSILAYKYGKKNMQIIERYNNEIILQAIKKHYKLSL